MASNDEDLYFLCRDWTFVDFSPPNSDVIFEDDSASSILSSPQPSPTPK